LEGSVSYSYVVELSCVAQPLDPWVSPEFTGKVVKSFIYLVPELGYVKNIYSLPSKPKPVSVSPLISEGRALVGSQKTPVAPGTRLSFFIRVAVPSMDEVTMFPSFDTEVVFGKTRFRVWLESMEVVSVDAIRAGLDEGKLARLRFLSPVLLSSKLMAPPLPSFLKRVASIDNFVLYPSLGHIFSYLARLWNSLFPHKPISRKYTSEWSAYFIGRLAEVLIKVVDYRSRPLTVVYDATRRPRGFVGWLLIDIPKLGSDRGSRRIREIFDRLLGLARVMGIGRSRAIGFGYTIVELIDRKR